LPLVARIAHLPCRIVHGRFDMVCPADQAVDLAARWPGAELAVVNAAGHWTFEPGNLAALRAGAAALASSIAQVKSAAA
jgi:proline iminopeptidase